MNSRRGYRNQLNILRDTSHGVVIVLKKTIYKYDHVKQYVLVFEKYLDYSRTLSKICTKVFWASYSLLLLLLRTFDFFVYRLCQGEHSCLNDSRALEKDSLQDHLTRC